MSDYKTTFSDFIEKYKREFGERKFNKVHNKIYSSSKIERLIQKSKDLKHPPNSAVYLALLHEIPFFIFSNADTIALGAILATERWNEECNKSYNLSNDDELYFLLLDIFQATNKFRLNL